MLHQPLWASKKTRWKGDRVVDCGGLENRRTERFPGFESLSFLNLTIFGFTANKIAIAPTNTKSADRLSNLESAWEAFF